LLAIGFVLWLRSGKTSGATLNQDRTLMLGHAQYWRSRADEARVLAELLEDAQSRRIMLGIAGDYERMAELAEQRLKSNGLPSAPCRARKIDLKCRALSVCAEHMEGRASESPPTAPSG